MKRYLVIFITDGEFACDTIAADCISRALAAFVDSGMAFDEIYSISRAA